MTKHYIRIELQEVRKHLDHAIEIDYGSASFHGETPRYQFSIWCKQCLTAIGSSITLKGEEV